MEVRIAWVGQRLGAGIVAAAVACLAVAGGVSAGVPQPPTAVTGAVTSYGSTSATVAGTVNPNGLATTWYFEYGKTTSYGSKTATTSAGSGVVNDGVSATIVDLTPATTYHYRFVAMSAAGTTQGADGLFTTAAATPPEAVTGSATGLFATGATLNGTVNPNGLPATWYFEYGTSTSYGSKTPSQNGGSGTSALGVSAPVGGLTIGRLYHFRLVVTTDAGTSRGSDKTFSLGVAPAATTRSASSISTTSATLNGDVNPNGQDTSWHFEYGTSTSYGSTTSNRSAGSGTSTTGVSRSISGLTAGTTYHYRLVASNAAGTSVGSDQTFVTVAAPSAQTGAAQSIGTTSATLTGAVDPRGVTTSWYFEYGKSTSYGSRTSTRSESGSGSHGVSAGISGLASLTTYHYRLVASNAAGTSVGSDQTFVTVGAPSAQTGPAQSIGTTSATLTGAVDARGVTTSWYFEYGKSTSYGSRTSTRSESGSGSRGVSAGISGLASLTTYHYRLVATSSLGTTRGADAAFTTAGASISLNQPALLTTFGGSVTLTGTASGGQSGVEVTVLAQRFGEGSFSSIATVRTGDGGQWSYSARPTIRTSYSATANGATSRQVTVSVRPAVSLSVRNGRFSTHVDAGTSFAGRFVQLQRRANGRWITVKRARLNGSSSATFRASALPHGRSTIRIAMSVNQAGPGYLAGFSRTVGYRRG